MERSRRKYEAENATRTIGQSMSAIMWRIIEGGMSWFVVSLVGKLPHSPFRAIFLCFFRCTDSLTRPTTTGAAIGLQAALSSILTTWLSDLKLGYCSQGWYLNHKFCCWEIEDELCEDWKTWTSFAAIQWGVYVGFAVSASFNMLLLRL